MIISYRPRLEMGSIFLARSRVGLTFYLKDDIIRNSVANQRGVFYERQDLQMWSKSLVWGFSLSDVRWVGSPLVAPDAGDDGWWLWDMLQQEGVR